PGAPVYRLAGQWVRRPGEDAVRLGCVLPHGSGLLDSRGRDALRWTAGRDTGRGAGVLFEGWRVKGGESLADSGGHPLAIRALIENGSVAEWRVYADNEPMRRLMM